MTQVRSRSRRPSARAGGAGQRCPANARPPASRPLAATAPRARLPGERRLRLQCNGGRDAPSAMSAMATDRCRSRRTGRGVSRYSASRISSCAKAIPSGPSVRRPESTASRRSRTTSSRGWPTARPRSRNANDRPRTAATRRSAIVSGGRKPRRLRSVMRRVGRMTRWGVSATPSRTSTNPSCRSAEMSSVRNRAARTRRPGPSPDGDPASRPGWPSSSRGRPGARAARP